MGLEVKVGNEAIKIIKDSLVILAISGAMIYGTMYAMSNFDLIKDKFHKTLNYIGDFARPSSSDKYR